VALLRTLTLIYAGVLVAALAGSLALIAVYLWRIARVLRGVQLALATVRDRTAPIRQHLEPLAALTKRHVEEFGAAATALDEARQHLAGRTEPAALAR
jgi:hypothetical protein